MVFHVIDCWKISTVVGVVVVAVVVVVVVVVYDVH
jgi:hypothetical protein